MPDCDEWIVRGSVTLESLQHTRDCVQRGDGCVRLCAVSRDEQLRHLHEQSDADDIRDFRALACDNALSTMPGDSDKHKEMAAAAAQQLLDAAADDTELFAQHSGAVQLQAQRCVSATTCDKLFEVRILALDAFSPAILACYFDKSEIDKVFDFDFGFFLTKIIFLLGTYCFVC